MTMPAAIAAMASMTIVAMTPVITAMAAMLTVTVTATVAVAVSSMVPVTGRHRTGEAQRDGKGRYD